MPPRPARRAFRTRYVGHGRVGHSIENALQQDVCQSTLCIDGLRIERQCVLEQINGLPESVGRPWHE